MPKEEHRMFVIAEAFDMHDLNTARDLMTRAVRSGRRATRTRADRSTVATCSISPSLQERR